MKIPKEMFAKKEGENSRAFHLHIEIREIEPDPPFPDNRFNALNTDSFHRLLDIFNSG